jgi:hypothetical protein
MACSGTALPLRVRVCVCVCVCVYIYIHVSISMLSIYYRSIPDAANRDPEHTSSIVLTLRPKVRGFKPAHAMDL